MCKLIQCELKQCNKCMFWLWLLGPEMWYTQNRMGPPDINFYLLFLLYHTVTTVRHTIKRERKEEKKQFRKGISSPNRGAWRGEPASERERQS